MMRGCILALVGLFLSAISSAAPDVSVSCMMVYDEGGAPAVLESPECPHWKLYPLSHNQTKNCQFAMLQGHRKYQEDRLACNLKLNIPSLDGVEELLVGVAAVFDGHGGKEASEMASKNFLDYFFVHVVFNIYKQALFCNAEHNLVFEDRNKDKLGYCGSNLARSGKEFMHEILKEALLRTIHDIDTKFSVEALNKRYISGSTATVALLFDGQILVANVGDSKALLCSQNINSSLEDEGTSTTVINVEQLTRDHHPDRDDERTRIEAAGGFIRTLGVPRVNGILAVSRSIGDVYLKRFGVSPMPEVMDWRYLSDQDTYLVVASDGIFESITPHTVCDLLLNENVQVNGMPGISSSCSSYLSLADCLVNKALEEVHGRLTVELF
ncbi:Phosphoprotein phosphatase [Bertholletia excelsa]